ncbi:RNA-binding S4 domain-containing protein [Sphingobium fluviale]|uniref:RNA-binding S4 domain-containing protein n=1 Tax=Sphingobium fluviale TaxID=2506423 RepID=A0A4V1N367_9SPHN|nr:RNA-binding S4 domain-containing protein [Sphingobium fluviale]RXR25612.1 RNA-binding S4 domain-containing protein [Sphingobium fluviale]
MRIDKFLWFARLAKSRTAAQAMAEQGIMRLNGRRIERAHSAARVGDLVTLAQGDRIRVVRILALPARRGPAAEAQACYEELMLGGSPSQLDIDGGAGRE